MFFSIFFLFFFLFFLFFTIFNMVFFSFISSELLLFNSSKNINEVLEYPSSCKYCIIIAFNSFFFFLLFYIFKFLHSLILDLFLFHFHSFFSQYYFFIKKNFSTNQINNFIKNICCDHKIIILFK
jgi:hypothetical protein